MLARIDQTSEQIATTARLVVVAIMGGIIVSAVGPAELRHDQLLMACLAANATVSVLAMLVTRRQLVSAWLSWTAGFLDVAILLGVVLSVIRKQAGLPDCYVPARVATWGIFLAFGLSALRGRPTLLVVQTALFVLGLFLFEEPDPVAGLMASKLPMMFAPACGPGQSAIRIAVVCLAGAMLVVASLRARITAHAAVVAARKAARLSSYFAPPVASVLVNTDIVALKEGRHQNVAVLFADLRGFTAMTETLPPREIADLLTTFRDLAAAAIEEEGGVIDKFSGDEVMGLFGVPASTSFDAERAVRAATRLLDAIEGWNAGRAMLSLDPIRAGVGVHYGPVFVGVLGRDRLEFTVLGSTVNAARRMEQMTRELGEDCIVSAWTIRAARGQHSNGWTCRGLGMRTLRGQSDPISLFTLRPRREGGALAGDARATPLARVRC